MTVLRQSRQSDFANGRLSLFGGRVVAPGCRRIRQHIRLTLGTIVPRQEGRARPGASDPSHPSLLSPLEIDPGQAVPALAHITAEKNQRLAISGAITGYKQSGL